MESLFTAVDGVLSFAPVWLRLIILGLPTGAFAMGAYGKLSPQDKLDELNVELSATRKEMNAYSGTDPKVVMELSKRNMALAFKQVGLIFPATMLAALPVIAILYGVDLVYAGQTVLSGVPDWFSTWEGVFLIAMSLGAIVIKVALKIR